MNIQKTKQYFSVSAVIGFVTAVMTILAAMVSISGYRLGWWRQTEAFLIFEWATYAALFSVIILVFSAIKMRSHVSKSWMLFILLGIVLSLPILTLTTIFEYSAKIYPPINDITTDMIDPPSFWDVPNPVDYPGSATANLQQAAYPDLKPLLTSLSSQQAFDRALLLAVENNWEIVTQDADEGRIEAVESSLLFGFKDEVVIRITASDQGSIIDVRSRSRIGSIDRGANARRISQFLKKMAVLNVMNAGNLN